MPGNSVNNAKTLDAKAGGETQNVEKEFFISVFFDGTSNKMETNTQQDIAEQTRSKANQTNKSAKVGTGAVAEGPKLNLKTSQLKQKDTNVAALSTLVENQLVNANGKKKYYYHTYIEGPGTTYDGGKKDKGWYEELKAMPAEKASSIIGMAVGAWSQGVIAKVARGVSDVHRFLNNHTSKNERITTKVHFCVFGFSRGAACARLFAYLVARAADNNNTITFESDFKDYLDGPARQLYTDRLHFLDEYQKQNRLVEYLGIYDTVSSIGLIDEDGSSNNGELEVSDFLVHHNLNASQYGLFSPQLKNVKHTFHICAIDEYRKNFAITDVGKSVPSTCIEAFVPGCHSDVGGSYEDNLDSTGCLKTKLNDKPTMMAMKHPVHPEGGTGEVNLENLMTLGWAVEKGFLEGIGESLTSNFTYSRNPTINWIQDTISFKRTVKRGLSNITMKMMWQRVNDDIAQAWGRELFVEYRQLSDFVVPSELNSYANLMDSSKLSYGKRHWLLPGESLSSASYNWLRSRYIHFSASDRAGISLVNGPNWKENLLCRIVYHGDRNDSGIYYIQDYA